MKLRFLLLPALVFAAVALADRTDVWLSSSVVVERTILIKRPDGGCAVAAEARYSKSDGGIARVTSSVVDVSGANRTACLDILDNKAPVLFKADEGL